MKRIKEDTKENVWAVKMSKWMSKLIKKNTVECFFCNELTDKKKAYTITMDTADGPHEVKACKKCSETFDGILKQIEDIHNGRY